MPRPGGEADKLGNQYEGIWTIGCLLKVADGTFSKLVVEPIGDSTGIEFVATTADGVAEFHSAKRQHAGGEWSLAKLTRNIDSSGRSVLGDLVQRLVSDVQAKCCFVSSTGATDLLELSERAERSTDSAQCEENLRSSSRLYNEFSVRFLPLVSNDLELAYSVLHRLRVVLINQRTLTQNVDQVIGHLVYRPDGVDFGEIEVRVLLGDFIGERLGAEIRQEDVWEHLRLFGYATRDWSHDQTIREAITTCNETYLRTVQTELINGSQLPRSETETIRAAIEQPDCRKTILVSAAAGVGKSCVLAQVLTALDVAQIPSLVVRLDRHADAHNPTDIGRQMGLPRSPVIVLNGLSNGMKCVLVIDQLDAVSQVSGRYPQLWEVFDILVREAERYPNLRLIIACRQFDLANDHRLRHLSNADTAIQVEVALLSTVEVKQAIERAGLADCRLSAVQEVLLRTPLHLSLFLSAATSGAPVSGFASVGDLLRLYWERKQRAVQERMRVPSSWMPVIARLCDAMNERLSVVVPDISVDEWPETVRAMLTEHVLVADDHKIRFFHESFFDYAFARYFASRGRSLTDFLQSGEQHLFRRSQVRQILAFLRDYDRDRYLTELRALLHGNNVRFHLQRLILQWLGTVDQPSEPEWQILELLLADLDLRSHVLLPIRNSLGWFDLLHRRGTLRSWLAGSDDAFVNHAIWLCIAADVQQQRSEIVAGLLRPYLSLSDEWTRRLTSYFEYARSFRSRPIQELFLDLLQDGAFLDGPENHLARWWHHLHDAAKECPSFALEAVCHWIDHTIKKSERCPEGIAHELKRYDQSAVLLLNQIATADPQLFVSEILPRVISITRITQHRTSSGATIDRVWYPLTNMDTFSIEKGLLSNLVDGLRKLSQDNPQQASETITVLLTLESYTISYILLQVFSANPRHFADACFRYIAEASIRLDIGYGVWTDRGNGHAAVSREAIEACVPFATETPIRALEAMILRFNPPGDEGPREGWHGRLLLESMAESHLSEEGRLRLHELRKRFPDQDLRIAPHQDSMLRCAASPISAEDAAALSDDEWLSAMKEYDCGWDGRPSVPNSGTRGTAVELSRVLQTETRKDRNRFAGLSLRMGDEIRSEYFEAILDGICGIENLPKEERDADNVLQNQFDTSLLMNVIERCHRLPGRPCGRSICRAFEQFANRQIPDSQLEILEYYALSDPDPAPERWASTELERDPAENLHFHGYNAVRGIAARAIAASLFADYSRFRSLLPTLRQMVTDPSPAVRSCVIDALLPILNHDRDEAVRLYRLCCDGCDAIVGTHPGEEFVRFAAWSHYGELRAILQRALASTSTSAVKAASRQICLAAFSVAQSQADAESVMSGTELMRIAAADVYAHNVGDAAIRATCESQLRRFFVDESSEVRATAAACFHYIGSEGIGEYSDLIRACIESPAFPSPHDRLILALGESTWQLPDVTLRLAERFVAASRTAASDTAKAAAFDAETVSKIVIRLYSQSNDEGIRRGCLELIDQMELYAFYGIDAQLVLLDR